MKIDSRITQKELDAIRFYMGDPEIVNRGDFRGGPKAFNTINALLHSGIQNELDKIREGRVLEIEDAAHVKNYIELCLSVFAAMEKYRQQKRGTEKRLVTYRVDRESMVRELQGKEVIEGFYSTCKYGFLESYAHIKENVALIEIRRGESVPYLDFEELFEGGYAKPEEAEILIPFGMRIKSLETVKLSEDEKARYTDIKGNPPCAKYVLSLTDTEHGMRRGSFDRDSQETRLLQEILQEENVKRVRKCLRELMRTQGLNQADMEFYAAWKENLKTYIKRELFC